MARRSDSERAEQWRSNGRAVEGNPSGDGGCPPDGNGAHHQPDGVGGVEGVAGGTDQDSTIRFRAPLPSTPPMRSHLKLRPPNHGPADDWLAERYPMLAWYLYAGSWDGIQPRMPAKLSISAKGRMVIGLLQCPTEGLQTDDQAESFDELLEQLNTACANPQHPWREMNWGTGAQKRRDLRKKEVDNEKHRNDDKP
jgi:hypothetical protein